MAYKIEKLDLFNDGEIGPAAKRLGMMFNISAGMKNSGDPLEHVETLFLSTTGLTEVPEFNQAEISYLKLKLMQAAVTSVKGNLYGKNDLADQTQLMVNTAEASNFLKAKAPAPK